MNSTSKIPIIVSAFVCPGAGQLLQKRWIAGALFMTGFLSGFIWVMFTALRVLAAYYSMALDMDAELPENTGIGSFIAPLLLAVTFYLLNLFDMAAQNGRAAREIFQDIREVRD